MTGLTAAMAALAGIALVVMAWTGADWLLALPVVGVPTEIVTLAWLYELTFRRTR